MDAASLEVSGDKGETGDDDGLEQGVRQIEEDEDVTIEKQRRRRVTSKQPARQSSPEDERRAWHLRSLRNERRRSRRSKKKNSQYSVRGET